MYKIRWKKKATNPARRPDEIDSPRSLKGRSPASPLARNVGAVCDGGSERTSRPRSTDRGYTDSFYLRSD